MTSNISMSGFGNAVDYEADSIYVHIEVKRDMNQQKNAEKLARLLQTVIDHLAEKFPVYIRREISVEKHKEFELNQVTTYVTARFSIGDPQVRTPGKIQFRHGEGWFSSDANYQES